MGIAPRRKTRRRLVVIVLTVLPFWLLASTIGGWYLWQRGREESPGTAKFRTALSVEGLASDLRKLAQVAGPRGADSDRGATGLRRAAAMIQGTLGPANAGYTIETRPGPTTPRGSWPIIHVRLPGEGPPVVWLAGYDARGDGPGVEHNATGVASLLAAAQALAGTSLGRPVVFAWVPHSYGDSEWVAAVEAEMVEAFAEAGAWIWVEALGRGAALHATGCPQTLAELGLDQLEAAPDETEAATGFQRLRAAGQPIVRLATGVPSGERDDRLPDPAVHRQATTRLIDWIERLAQR